MKKIYFIFTFIFILCYFTIQFHLCAVYASYLVHGPLKYVIWLKWWKYCIYRMRYEQWMVNQIQFMHHEKDTSSTKCAVCSKRCNYVLLHNWNLYLSLLLYVLGIGIHRDACITFPSARMPHTAYLISQSMNMNMNILVLYFKHLCNPKSTQHGFVKTL